jgi:predicted MFS family arabinose efflux permease
LTTGQRNFVRFVAVILPILLYSIFRFSVGPLLPSIQSVFLISVAASGTLVSASTIAVAVGTGLSGYLVSKFGEQKTVFAGLVVFSIPLGASVITRNFGLFAPLFVASGLGSGLMTTPTYSIAAAMFPERKGTAVGFVSASYNLGGFIGPSLAGVLLNYLGWEYPFYAMGLMGIVFAFIFRANLSGYKTPQRDTSLTLSKEFRNLVSNKNVLLVAISMFLTDLGFFAYVTYTVQFLGERFSLSPAGLVPIDVYFGAAVGIGGLGVIVLGLLYDKVGGKITVVLDGTAIAFLSFALYSTTSLVAAVLLMFVVGFFVNSPWGILSTVVQANVPEYSRGSAVSLVQTVAFIGAVLGLEIAAVLFGNAVTAGPLFITVTFPYAIFAVVFFALYSTARAKTATPNRESIRDGQR